MSDALADLAAAAARCAGSDEMALPRVVLCIRFWTMEFLLSGRTMVLLGIERCSGLQVGNKMVLPLEKLTMVGQNVVEACFGKTDNRVCCITII